MATPAQPGHRKRDVAFMSDPDQLAAPSPEAVWRSFRWRLSHSLANSELFTDDALARLIEASAARGLSRQLQPEDAGQSAQAPRRRDPGPDRRRRARRRPQRQYLDQPDRTRRCRLRPMAPCSTSHLRRVRRARAGLQELQAQPHHPDLFAQRSVKYHSDVPGQSLWQVRGTKKLYVYPAQGPVHLASRRSKS